MHLDEEQIQRLLHGEVLPRETSVLTHLASCAACNARLSSAERDEREVHALLRHLDHPVPHVDPRALALPAESRAPRWGRWAAGIVLALGLGSASYAIPGSPLPGWIGSVVDRVAGRAQRALPAPPTDADVHPGPTSEPAIAGISVMPGAHTRIRLTSAHGWSHVSLSDGPEIVVRAPAGATTFTSEVDGLVIHNADPNATIEIEIPRAAPRVEITVGPETVFLKEGLRVTTHVDPMSADAYFLEFGAPTSATPSDVR
jgi:hypothetical protein